MLKELLEQSINKEEIIDFLSNYHAYDIAEMFNVLDEEQKNFVLDLLDTELQAEVLSYLSLDDAVEVLENLSLDEQKKLVEELEPDDAANIINELDDEDKENLIAILDKDEEVLSLINYDENEAGSFMTNNYLVVSGLDDVKDATKKLIKKAQELDSIQTIFAVNEDNKYLGQVSLKTLIRAKSPKLMNEIIVKEPTFYVDDDVDLLVKHLKHYGGYDVPIINKEKQLVGMISQDDILDIYIEEAEEDYQKLAALPDLDIETSTFKTAMHRIPWLIILLLVSIPSALVTSNFNGIVSAFVILAFFQPLILDAGGDVASQTLAVTLIELTKKDAKVFKNGIKEILTGVLSGLVMGLLAFIVTIILSNILKFDHSVLVALSIGLAVWVTVIMGPILGFLIPVIINKLKFDPAVASGPFITNLIDISSNIIYFTIATLILGGLQ